jgi:hypothetical protein
MFSRFSCRPRQRLGAFLEPDFCGGFHAGGDLVVEDVGVFRRRLDLGMAESAVGATRAA